MSSPPHPLPPSPPNATAEATGGNAPSADVPSASSTSSSSWDSWKSKLSSGWDYTLNGLTEAKNSLKKNVPTATQEACQMTYDVAEKGVRNFIHTRGLYRFYKS